MKREPMPMPCLHVYPQILPHGDLVIIGNESGLTELLNAVSAALKTGDGVGKPFTTDGEGYFLIVGKATDENMDEIAMPYDEEWGGGHPGSHPYGKRLVGRCYEREIAKRKAIKP